MHAPKDEPDLFPESSSDEDEQVQITDLDPPDAPTHFITRFLRSRYFTQYSPRTRLWMTIATGTVTLALFIVFVVVNVLPAINISKTPSIRNPISISTYPLEMSVVGNTAYVTTSTGEIEALRLSDGSLVWQYQTDVPPLQGPIIVNGMAYFVSSHEEFNTSQGSVYALRIKDGTLAWHHTIPLLNPQTFAVQQDIIVYSVENTLYAIRANDGSAIWHYDTGFLPPEYELPDPQGGRVYINSQFGDIYALDTQNGNVLWHFSINKQHFSLTQVLDGFVYVTAQDGTLYVIDGATGHTLWHFSGSSGKNLAGALLTVLGSVVYLSTNDGTINALRLYDGKLLWQYQQAGVIWQVPMETANIVYLSSQIGTVDALQADTGRLLWHYESIATEASLVSVENERVFVVSRDGTLNVLDANDGFLRWYYTNHESGTTQGSPIVAQGVALITFSNGTMYALRVGDGAVLWHAPVSIFGGGFTFVLNNTVYIGAPEGGVSALRLSDGTRLWHSVTT